MNRWIFALLVLALAFCGRDGVRAQSEETPKVVQKKDELSDLKDQLKKKDDDLEKLGKILNAYQNKFFNCDAQLTAIQAMKQ